MTDIQWTSTTAKLGSLKPWQGNPKTSTGKQHAQLTNSFDELGQFQTVAISPTGDVYDGHQRLSALLAKHGKDYEVQALQSSRPLTDEERRKIAIYSRQIGAWDWDTLSSWDAGELMEWGFDEDLLKDWGQDYSALSAMLESEEPPEPADAEPQTNRADELRELWGVETGQMWRLPSRVEGQEHRLICGDCTDEAVVKRVMDGEVAELLFTSPPYADMREYSGNDLSIEILAKIFYVWDMVNYFCVNLGIQFKDDEIYQYWDEWIRIAKESGNKLLSWNIWDRINATSVSSQTKMFAITHEFIFVFGKLSKPLNRTWDKSEESKKRERYYATNENGQKVTTRRQADGSVSNSVIGTIYDNKNMGTVFTGYAEMERSVDHPAKFTVDLPSGYMGAMTNEDDIVCEPFSGSGTTIIASENLSRQCRAVEISPAYVAVALQRYQDAFGITPELISDVWAGVSNGTH